MAFTRAFLNEYLVTYFNDKSCYKRGDKTQPISLVQNFITSGNDLNVDLQDQTPGSFGVYEDLSSIEANKKPLIKVSGFANSPVSSPKFKDETHYLTFHAGRTLPMEKTNGNREQDAKQGIYHFLAGRSKGITKTISLKRTNAKGLPEVRFESSGYDGLSQLIDVYDVEIKTEGFLNVLPGSYIYVDPKSFDPNPGIEMDLTTLGIGGYCMVTDVQHTVLSKLETTISARWQSPKEGTDRLKANDQSFCAAISTTGSAS